MKQMAPTAVVLLTLRCFASRAVLVLADVLHGLLSRAAHRVRVTCCVLGLQNAEAQVTISDVCGVGRWVGLRPILTLSIL